MSSATAYTQHAICMPKNHAEGKLRADNGECQIENWAGVGRKNRKCMPVRRRVALKPYRCNPHNYTQGSFHAILQSVDEWKWQSWQLRNFTCNLYTYTPADTYILLFAVIHFAVVVLWQLYFSPCFLITHNANCNCSIFVNSLTGLWASNAQTHAHSRYGWYMLYFFESKLAKRFFFFVPRMWWSIVVCRTTN